MRCVSYGTVPGTFIAPMFFSLLVMHLICLQPVQLVETPIPKKKKKKKWARCMHFAFALCTGCKNYTYYAHTLIFVRISDVIFVMTCDMAGSLLW